MFQAFSSLAEAAFEANISEEEEEPETYELSAKYEDIVHRLLETTDRYMRKFRCSVYCTIMMTTEVPSDAFTAVTIEFNPTLSSAKPYIIGLYQDVLSLGFCPSRLLEYKIFPTTSSVAGREAECPLPPPSKKNCQKSGKREQKSGKERGELRKTGKIGKVLSLCPS